MPLDFSQAPPEPRTLEEARAIIRAVWHEVGRLGQAVVMLRSEGAALHSENGTLRERVAELERRLDQNSQNSSRPPSSDPPGLVRLPKAPPSGRKPGGQPGHEGHGRALLPLERVDHFKDLKPRRCRRCGRALRGEDPSPQRRQVIEVPPVRAEVTEYRLHTLLCPCGAETAAELPKGVPRGAFGPRVQAVVALSTGLYHVSKRVAGGLLSELFGVELSLGSVSACEAAASEAVAAPVAEAHAYVQRQEIANADETGWREARRRAWLWVAVTRLVTVFMVDIRRGREAAQALLGKFAGFLGTDRWSAYNAWAVEKRQICWAHLRRLFVSWIEAGGEAGRIGLGLLEEADRMFRGWHEVKRGAIARDKFRERMGPVRKRVEALLAEGVAGGEGGVAGPCREILKLAPALWTFVEVEGLEPTNNAAEQAIRTAVLWRKGSFGTHSPGGSRFAERMLTVSATLKQQGRSVVDFVAQACEAALHGQAPPSLLPIPASRPPVAMSA